MSRERPAVVVAGHVCVDLIPSWPPGGAESLAELLRPGRLTEVGAATLSTGGAVSNTGLALHRLGVPVRLVGKVGDDLLGPVVRGVFAAAGVDTSRTMIVDPAADTSYTVVLNPPGVDRVFLHCPGANHTFCAADVDGARLTGARLLHFGYPPLMRRMYERDGEEARALFARARAAGVATSLDLSLPDPASPSGRVDWRRWLDRVLPAVDFCVPSAEEVLFMLDPGEFSRRAAGPGGVAATLDRPRLRELAGALLERGAAAVLLKCGDQGAFLRVSGDAARLRAVGGGFPAAAADWAGFEGAEPCFAVEVAGTTGSGDCTIAGFLCGLLDGTGPREALVRAVAAGAASVERPDATSGVPRWEDLARRLAAGWTSRPSRLL